MSRAFVLVAILICGCASGTPTTPADPVQPDLVKITTQYAVIRTAHALVGSCLLATAVVIALRLCRPSAVPIATPDRTNSEWSDTGGYESRNATVSSGA